MKKICLILILVLLLCGCEKNKENEYSEGSYYIGNRFTLYVDEETCVEYFVSNGTSSIGIVTPKYNQDGTLKLNKKCIEKENN